MTEYEASRIWRYAFDVRDGDSSDEKNARSRLRLSWMKARDRASAIAETIQNDLPGFTVHDVSHLDALWRTADLVTGDTYLPSPTEVYLLGLSILLHDLGMGLAAHPDGAEALRRDPRWGDAVASLLRRALGRPPTPAEVEDADDATREIATAQLLRELHAERAEELGMIGWTRPDNQDRYFLIDDPELRYGFGRTAGLIAASHHWDVEELGERLAGPREGVGAPVGFPRPWTFDPLRVACVLRLADAANLDASRAPGFLRTLRQPAGYSALHWTFQEKLAQPSLDGDQLVYTSTQDFLLEEADAWWVCFDSLRMVDQELLAVDGLLADTDRQRFAARRVAGIDSPLRLSRAVRTDDWEPVDTAITISDVPALVARFGGEALYGPRPDVVLRELVQNAGDAVRARTVKEAGFGPGSVTVGVGSDESGPWLCVSDNGVGMSRRAITAALLDFGSSYWGSALMREEHPGLMAAGFDSAGRYGIGFFSVFMLGDRVQVITRTNEDGASDTRVLEFGSGLDARPTLRRATPAERRTVPGTSVKVWADSRDGYDYLYRTESLLMDDALFESDDESLKSAIGRLFCSVDFNIIVSRQNGDLETAISANDWITLSSEDLLRRIAGSVDRYHEEALQAVSGMVSPIGPPDNPIGRAALCHLGGLGESFSAISDHGLFAGSLYDVAGVLPGRAVSATRDTGVCSVEPAMLEAWVRHQVALLVERGVPDERLLGLHAPLITAGFALDDLPFLETSDGYLSPSQFRAWAAARATIGVLEPWELSDLRRNGRGARVPDDTIAVPSALRRLPFELPDPLWTTDETHLRDTSPFAYVLFLLRECWDGDLVIEEFEFENRPGRDAGVDALGPLRVSLSRIVRRTGVAPAPIHTD